jgi:hypothetical protein
MEKKYLLYIIVLSSCFLSTVGAEEHGSYVLSKAQDQFGTKMSVDKYKKIKESIIYEHEEIEQSHYPNIAQKGDKYVKSHFNSKSGNTLLVYSAYKGEHGIGSFTDIIRLKDNFNELKSNDKSFKEFSFPVIASLKVWSKNSGLKIPKPLIDIILQYGYPYRDFDYDRPREIVSSTLYQQFNECGYNFYNFNCCSLFVDDQKNIVINFKDKKNNENILYAQTKGLYAHKKNSSAQLLLIVPSINRFHRILVESQRPKISKPGQIEIVDEYLNKAVLIENPELCKPGQIEIDSIDNNSLKVTKDGKKFYTINY